MVGKQKLNSVKDRSLCGLNIQRFFHPDFKRTWMDFVMLLLPKCINFVCHYLQERIKHLAKNPKKQRCSTV